jgi:hypothetical protein
MNVKARLEARQRRFIERILGLGVERDEIRNLGLPFNFQEGQRYKEHLAAAIRALDGARLVLFELGLRLKSENRL